MQFLQFIVGKRLESQTLKDLQALLLLLCLMLHFWLTFELNVENRWVHKEIWMYFLSEPLLAMPVLFQTVLTSCSSWLVDNLQSGLFPLSGYHSAWYPVERERYWLSTGGTPLEQPCPAIAPIWAKPQRMHVILCCLCGYLASPSPLHPLEGHWCSGVATRTSDCPCIGPISEMEVSTLTEHIMVRICFMK